MEEKKGIFTGSKEYLEKSFLEELSYKIWSTKGARFQADKRLTVISKMSNISFSILSAYLIIAGLIAVYNLNKNDENLNLINYLITALSIIQLVLAQYENSQDYKLKAKNFHDCGLELSVLYNKLRIFKTLKTNPNENEIYNFCKELSEEYQVILAKYENHHPIDYQNFKKTQRGYFKELTDKDSIIIKIKYIWICYGWYSLLIVSPPLLIISYFIF
ncbi:SLATT domain-containing protein [Flavobacterium proteolyticum]|uniref:SLATT domain-containing protein n=1 Tax=Flavobacterium proteolyticum TaxID=2911683 RepID=A0ABR9WUS9_9FLAO|nr:SLATT domain-containing protein [Flavobacterium proteolyticum]MBE9577416.1 SLATT domain-containing protein [Flavobacterium proteolyticum]